MKRKHGNKKEKEKKPKLASTNDLVSNASLNTEKNLQLDEFDSEEGNSAAVADAEKLPSPSGTNNPENEADSDPFDRPVANTSGKVVYTRVKVKLKSSKRVESPLAISDAPAQSDTDKSSLQFYPDKPAVPSDKMDDSSNSLSETNGGVPANTSKKSIGIKIKSSRGLSSSMSPCSNTEAIKEDLIEKKDIESFQKESKYNEQELKLALEVIRKIMKMEAAEPFNAPVNPIALGIPDYFDVIDTPMDFGTICNNLEKGQKYKNGEDVLKDVQYIWDNCYKYNNKGDYILELMKRVKKNFTKYWTTVGLFCYQAPESNVVEINSTKDPGTPSEGNTPVSGGALLLSGKKFHGLKKHKEGCLCAICVMMRRRQEKEEIARMMGQTEGSNDSQDEDNKPEGGSHGGSPLGEYTSSNMGHSPDADPGQELKLGQLKSFYGKQKKEARSSGKRECSQSSHRSDGENGVDDHTPEMPNQNYDGNNMGIDQERPKDKNERARTMENLRYLENPLLLNLYGTLFSMSSKSFWSGPHSLIGVGGRNGVSNRRNCLASAVSSLMK